MTKLGEAQALATKAYFEGVNFDHVYSSTSERCCDTVELIVGFDVHYTRLKGLKEMNFGIFEGECEDLNPDRETFETFFQNYGGETRDECRNRVVETCHALMKQDDHNCVLAVSHAGACLRFLEHCYDPSRLPKGSFSNCAIFKYEYENGTFTFVEVIQKSV